MSSPRFNLLPLALSLAFAASLPAAVPETALIEVTPAPYAGALRNPLAGITGRTLSEHKWGTLTHHYIAWDEIESSASDGVEKIRAFCDAHWQGLPGKNFKVIPRVYLEYPGQDRKHWPKDLKTDDYESPQFAQRLAQLIVKLGAAWDSDPRVAFVELGIFGKWGEHHSPEPSGEMQAVATEAIRKAFPHKQVSVRQVWAHFPGAPVGEYWDSFAHQDEQKSNGAAIATVNQTRRVYETQYIGGEVAYDWGNWRVHPGESPTETLAVRQHREFMINTIRWLHTTQLRWIGDYDFGNAAAEAGAQEVQRALGYRFVIDAAKFSAQANPAGELEVALTVRNLGSAPFYYPWPLELSLLSADGRKVMWKATFNDVDIRKWLPGDGWTAPTWKSDGIAGHEPEASWPALAECGWSQAPKSYVAAGSFKPGLPKGRYILAVAILDPAGLQPSVKFATANYLKGGRHPLGLVGFGGDTGGALPANFVFDDPQTDGSLHYTGPAGTR